MTNDHVITKVQKSIILTLVALSLGYFLWSVNEPLLGVHRWRQADTLFASYFYCTEDSPFLLPKIAPRQNTPGVGIGEFPLYSYIISLKCKATGQWDEAFPKLVQLLFYFLLIGSWGLYLKRRYKDLTFSPWIWLALAGFMPNALRFYTIALPDGFALLLISISAHLWLSCQLIDDQISLKNQVWPPRFLLGDLKSFEFWLGLVIFAISFLIRPYYFFFILWLLSSNLAVLLTTITCIGLYIFWFKSWIHHSDLAQYYGTQLKSLSVLQGEWPKAFLGLLTGMIWDHMSYIGVLFFAKGFRKDQRLLLAWFLCLIILPTFRGAHFLTHRYYMLGGGILSAVIMLWGFQNFRWRYKNWIPIVMMVFAVITIQHNWQPDRDGWKLKMRTEAQRLMGRGEKLVTYHQFNPEWLYYPLKTGWTLDMNEYRGPEGCPEGANWALVVPEKALDFRFEKCKVR